MYPKSAIFALAMLCAGCTSKEPARHEPRRFEPDGPYLHRASGMSFPEALGGLTRTAITEYGKDATDISTGYNLLTPDLKAAITIYVYPAPQITSIGSPPNVIEGARKKLCSDHFENVKLEIERAHPSAKLVDEGSIASPSPDFSGPAKRARYTMTEEYGARVQPLRSEADVFCYIGGKWVIVYRTTAPADVDYEIALKKLMTAIAWPPST